MKTTAYFILATLLSFYFQIAIAYDYPDFDYAMLRFGDGKESLVRKDKYNSTNPFYLSLFRSIYDKNIAEVQANPSDVYKIPRIIHQIWLGSDVPDKFKGWMETWENIEGWEYKLWTDSDLEGFPMFNRSLYDQSTNWGEKSDILRLEILARIGGLYVDVDFECIQPEALDEFHRHFDLYIGFEPLEHGYIKKINMFKMCNAIMASSPNHPLIKDLISNLKANYYAYLDYARVVEKSGPAYITRIICQFEKGGVTNLKNIYFPSTVFYPLNEREMRKKLKESDKIQDIPPETVAIHYWSGSWKK